MAEAPATQQAIAGRYVLQDSLGKGGMGVVWRAQDLLLQRPVAIKEIQIPATVSDRERAVVEERAIREARAAASINHPNAVGVFDVLSDPSGSSSKGGIFIVMELIDAPTLAAVVADGPLSPERSAEIGLQLLDALEAAHARGIVHRDVKPANVMVSENGTVKLADFGIASVKGDPRLTASGLILGSPAYMAPEQATESIATTATDIWSLGATLYLVAEGHGPFDKGQPIPTLTAVISEEPKYTPRSGPLRPALEACLSKDPARRPSVPELRSMLQGVAHGRTATETVSKEAPEAEKAPAAEAPVALHPRTRRIALKSWTVAALILVALVGGIAIAALVRDPAPRTPAEAEGRGTEDQARGGNASDANAGQLPEGWAPYRDASTGYRIGYPEGWQIETGNGTPQSVDFVDPSTGAYLRVDWTDTPGDSPQAAWESYEPDFEAGHENYERISMEPTTFQSYEASHWEYTWGDGLHAVNLGFVTGDHGFALNYQAPEASWDDLQDTFETFKETFLAPG